VGAEGTKVVDDSRKMDLAVVVTFGEILGRGIIAHVGVMRLRPQQEPQLSDVGILVVSSPACYGSPLPALQKNGSLACLGNFCQCQSARSLVKVAYLQDSPMLPGIRC